MGSLKDIKLTGVKFYSSLTRRQAKGLDPVPDTENVKVLKTTSAISGVSEYYINSEASESVNPNWNGVREYYYKQSFVEPGAVCFVADEEGNSIFLNELLFGDGAVASGTSGSGTGGTAITEITLDKVIINKDGYRFRTLNDIIQSDGSLISNSLTISSPVLVDGQEVTSSVIISPTGITIAGKDVATKEYVNGLLSSVYHFQGSIDNYSDLPNTAAKGDVYNIKNSVKIGSETYPPGTNFAYTGTEWDSLGGSTITLTGYITQQQLNQILEGYATNLELLQVKNTADNALSIALNLELSIQNNTQSIGAVNERIDGLIGAHQTMNTNINNNKENINILTNQLSWQ